jgi:hypothetical protein
MLNKFEILHKYTTELFAMEKQLMESIEEQIEDRNLNRYSRAIEILRMIHPVLRSQVAILENLSARPVSEPLWKEAVNTVTSVFSGIYSKARPEKVSTYLQEVYVSLNLLSISYTTLHTAALALRDVEVADRALKHLRAITPLIVDISEVIPRVVLDELSDEQVEVSSQLADEAVRNTHAAWRAHGPSMTTH